VDAQARYDHDLANQVRAAQAAGKIHSTASVTEMALGGYNAGIGAVLAQVGLHHPHLPQRVRHRGAGGERRHPLRTRPAPLGKVAVAALIPQDRELHHEVLGLLRAGSARQLRHPRRP